MNDDTPEKPKLSEPFTRMAAAIEHNLDSKFGGAVVIVPPEGGGEPVELLMLDATASPAQFWATIKTKCDLVLDQINTAERMSGLGRR